MASSTLGTENPLMRIETETVAHAPVGDVWRWWTDYGPAGTQTDVSHGGVKSRRRIVENSGTRVVLEEAMPLPGGKDVRLLRHEVDIREGERRLLERAEAPLPMEAEWTFEPTADGARTVIRRVTHVRSRVADALTPVSETAMRKLIERDIASHVREFEAERGPSP